MALPTRKCTLEVHGEACPVTYLQHHKLEWRRERDSNPRAPFEANGFQDRRFQPLTHPSAGGFAALLDGIQSGTLMRLPHFSFVSTPAPLSHRGNSAGWLLQARHRTECARRGGEAIRLSQLTVLPELYRAPVRVGYTSAYRHTGGFGCAVLL